MSLKEAVAIAFSDHLDRAGIKQKQEALLDLAQYIEGNPNITNEDANGFHIIETIYSLFVSFVEENDLSKQYRITITVRDLAIEDAVKINRLGFDLYHHDGMRIGA